MLSWLASDVTLLHSGNSSLGESLTNKVISKEFRIGASGATKLVVAIKASGVTSATGITAKLQTAAGTDMGFEDSKTVTISGNDVYYIKLLAEASGDQTYLPLLSVGRVVVSTGAGDAVTIDKVLVLAED